MFTVDSCGYNIRNVDYDTIYRPNGSENYLFLLILSPMKFTFPSEVIEARAGACILYTPKFPQHYQSVKEFYNSYIHFSCSKEYLSAYSFPKNELFYPNASDDINWLIKDVQNEYLTKPLYYQQAAAALVTRLLIQIERACLQALQQVSIESSLLTNFQFLRIQMLSHCEEEWAIERMCQLVNLEKSQLYSYYHTIFHSTPKADLIQARIDKAKYLLTNNALQISQVAQASGFTSIPHFSRYFKKSCGCTPSEYAKNPTMR